MPLYVRGEAAASRDGARRRRGCAFRCTRRRTGGGTRALSARPLSSRGGDPSIRSLCGTGCSPRRRSSARRASPRSIPVPPRIPCRSCGGLCRHRPFSSSERSRSARTLACSPRGTLFHNAPASNDVRRPEQPAAGRALAFVRVVVAYSLGTVSRRTPCGRAARCRRRHLAAGDRRGRGDARRAPRSRGGRRSARARRRTGALRLGPWRRQVNAGTQGRVQRTSGSPKRRRRRAGRLARRAS